MTFWEKFDAFLEELLLGDKSMQTTPNPMQNAPITPPDAPVNVVNHPTLLDTFCKAIALRENANPFNNNLPHINNYTLINCA